MKTATVKADAKELKFLLFRSLNTLEPKDRPKWAEDLCDGLLPTDDVTFTLRRDDGIQQEAAPSV